MTQMLTPRQKTTELLLAVQNAIASTASSLRDKVQDSPGGGLTPAETVGLLSTMERLNEGVMRVLQDRSLDTLPSFDAIPDYPRVAENGELRKPTGPQHDDSAPRRSRFRMRERPIPPRPLPPPRRSCLLFIRPRDPSIWTARRIT